MVQVLEDVLVMNDLIQKIRHSTRLITLPEIYFQLRGLMDDPDFTMAEVTLLISQDPGLAARFLRIVNSSFYRRAVKIETIGHAVSMMGFQQVHDIVLSASFCTAFEGIAPEVINMRRFWQSSAYCAMTARQLAIIHGDVQADRLFMIGLLADIGHLCMYMGVPDRAQAAILRAREENRPLFMVEKEMLGFDFAQVGALMMSHWNLPPSLQLPIAFQTNPGKADDFMLETALLHLASVLVQADLGDGLFEHSPYHVDSTAWDLSGLIAEQCLQARNTAEQQYSEFVEQMF